MLDVTPAIPVVERRALDSDHSVAETLPGLALSETLR